MRVHLATARVQLQHRQLQVVAHVLSCLLFSCGSVPLHLGSDMSTEMHKMSALSHTSVNQ